MSNSITLKEMLHSYLDKWQLTTPSLIVETRASFVYRVSTIKGEAVLKILKVHREDGNEVEALKHFDGNGAVRIFEHDQLARLVSFAGQSDLASQYQNVSRIESNQAALQIISKLHKASTNIDKFPNLERVYKSLLESTSNDPLIKRAQIAAREILESETDRVILHGDIHHENILRSDSGEWLAIDPKGFYGERTYEFCNLFYNPIAAGNELEKEETIEAFAMQVSDQFHLKKNRLLKFAFVYGCLSFCWTIEDGEPDSRDLRIAAQIERLM